MIAYGDAPDAFPRAALTVNGIAQAGTDIVLESTLNSGSAQLNLAAGDVVTLRNITGDDFTTAQDPRIGAQINFVLIDPDLPI